MFFPTTSITTSLPMHGQAVGSKSYMKMKSARSCEFETNNFRHLNKRTTSRRHSKRRYSIVSLDVSASPLERSADMSYFAKPLLILVAVILFGAGQIGCQKSE